MSHLPYYNHWSNVTEIFFDSHKELIEKLCIELGQPDKISEMVEKYLDQNTKIKPKKDPNQPKKPKSGYMMFCQEKRETLMKDNPKWKITDVMVELGKLWGNLQEDEKEKYQELSEQDKGRYEEEMEQYQNSLHMQELMAFSSSANQ